MSTKTTILIVVILIALMVGVGLATYPMLPARVASHWNAQGQVNGYSSRAFGAFFLPVLVLVLTGILLLVPLIDPLRGNIEKFRKEFNLFIVVLAAFMLYIHILTLAWNVGYKFDLTVWMVPGLAGLMYLVGVLLGTARRNYFIGIRTPWTLQSETVWNKTHARGSVAFKIVGVLTLLGMFFPHAVLAFLVVPLIAAAIYLVIYSYVAFRQEEAAQKG
jgi:uncharacterized membrane protein